VGQALAEFALPTAIASPSNITPPSASGESRYLHPQESALARLDSLPLYPVQKHEQFDAVYSPLPWIPIVPTDKLKFRVTDARTQDVSTILTSQAYVYRRKLKWYILHPEQIEAPQLHEAKWWWRASVFHVGGKYFVGNGNHRVCAALLGWEAYGCWSTRRPSESAANGAEMQPWSMKTTFRAFERDLAHPSAISTRSTRL
jgi:hypothetical protein